MWRSLAALAVLACLGGCDLEVLSEGEQRGDGLMGGTHAVRYEVTGPTKRYVNRKRVAFSVKLVQASTRRGRSTDTPPA